MITRKEWDKFVDAVFSGISGNDFEKFRQAALEKGYIKSKKTPFGELFYWDHENVPEFTTVDKDPRTSFFDAQRLIEQKRKILHKKFNKEFIDKLYGFDKILATMKLHEIDTYTEYEIDTYTDLLNFFDGYWESVKGQQLVQVFHVEEEVWNKLFVILFHKERKVKIQHTDVAIEVTHNLGIAIFINEDYKG